MLFTFATESPEEAAAIMAALQGAKTPAKAGRAPKEAPVETAPVAAAPAPVAAPAPAPVAAPAPVDAPAPTPVPVAAPAPAPAPAPQPAAADANGWTYEHVKSVVLPFLQNPGNHPSLGPQNLVPLLAEFGITRAQDCPPARYHELYARVAERLEAARQG